MIANTVTETELTFTRHLRAAAEKDLDRMMTAYADDSVVYTPDGPLRGLTQIRHYYETLFDGLPGDWIDRFSVLRREMEGDVAYLVWKAEPFIPIATETFIVRGGKIVRHTSAAYPAFETATRTDVSFAG